MPDPLEGWQKLGPGDLVAHGLAKPGPLAGWVKQGADPAQNAQAIREEINPAPQPPTPLFSSPKGFYGPGLLANLESRLTGKTPQQAYEQRVPQLETASQLLGAAVAPGSGLLRQAGGQALMSGGLEALKGTGPLRAVGKGLESGIGGLVAGGLGRGLLQPAYQKAGSAATQAYEKAVVGRESGIKGMEAAHAMTGKLNKEMTGALNTLEKESYEAARTKFAQDSAARLAADLKKNTPALSPFPADEKGLADMLYGKGKAAVSRAFDKSLKEITSKHSGTAVEVPTEVMRKYGLSVMTPKLSGTGFPDPERSWVPASELADKMTGTWRKDPKIYRMAAEALDKAGVGDPKARAAYKYYIGQLDYFNATKAFKGEKFNPDAYRSGATGKPIEMLRRRGIGSLTEGPMELTKGGPLAPTPRGVPPQSPMPASPPEVAKPNIQSIKNPLAGHPFIGFAGGEALGYPIAGAPGAHIGGLLGLLGAQALPKDIVTKAPGVNPIVPMLIQALTKGGGAAGGLYGP